MPLKKGQIKKIIKHPGALTKKAKDAGKTIAEYCAGYDNLSTQSKRQCNFAKVLEGFNHKGKKGGKKGGSKKGPGSKSSKK